MTIETLKSPNPRNLNSISVMKSQFLSVSSMNTLLAILKVTDTRRDVIPAGGLYHEFPSRHLPPWSLYTGRQTEHSDPSNGIASPAQPLRLTNDPMPPLNQGLQSPQGKPPNPRNQRPPTKSHSPVIESPQVQHQSKDSVASEPNQTQQRSSRVQKSSQSTERSINSDVQRTLGLTKEVMTRSGRLLRPPTHINL